jgi:hypothetical protein
MDLWDFDLTPQEYMAAHFLERHAGRVSGREVAERLGLSEKTGRRILSSLARKGLIQRISRGRYALLWMTVEPAPVTVERSPMTVSKVLSSSTTTKPVLVDVPSGTSTRAARPFEGIHIEKRFPVADDIEPGRLKPPSPEKPKRSLFKKPDKYHRVTQPRESWGVSHVVKEFEIRSLQTFPNSVYVPEGRLLSATLSMAKRDYGISVEQMLTAIDQFFTHRAKNVPQDTSPSRHFLAYLKTYIEQQPGIGTVDLDPEKFDTSDWDRYNKGFNDD